MKNRVCALFGIDLPVIQAGMVWCSPWRLAAAVSNAGGLGIIGAASMYPEVLETHLVRCRAATGRPFAVNIPLLYPDLAAHFALIEKHRVPIVFTSAGNPRIYTNRLKEKGITVVHVVSSLKFARKAEDAGVDAVVAEGFEAGGHNGREETTTLCLVPAVAAGVDVPVIAAGGIGTGRAMLAAMVLGAEGVQIGSRFVASGESSAHAAFKEAVVAAGEGSTTLTLKQVTPVRMLKNAFYARVAEAEARCAAPEELREILGRGRAKKGMFEGDMAEGELEIGQVSAQIGEVLPAAEIVRRIVAEYRQAAAEIGTGGADRFDF